MYQSVIKTDIIFSRRKYLNIIGDEKFQNFIWNASSLKKSNVKIEMKNNTTIINMKNPSTKFYLILNSSTKNFNKINFEQGIEAEHFNSLEFNLQINDSESYNNRVTILIMEYCKDLHLINKIKFHKNITNFYTKSKDTRRIVFVIDIEGYKNLVINSLYIKFITIDKTCNNLIPFKGNSYFDKFKNFFEFIESEKNYFSSEAYKWKRKAIGYEKELLSLKSNTKKELLSQKNNTNNVLNSFNFDLLKKFANLLPVSNGCHFYKKIPYNLAIITDVYMFNYYKDCFENVYYLTPENYDSILGVNKIDIILYVSSWKGIDNEEWRGIKFREKQLQALEAIIKFAKNEKVKLVFQSIEDPSNFDYFLPIAEKFDYVFTSDSDMIEHYKKELGHDNIFYGEYGFNPLLNNPIASQRDLIDGVFFAGSYTTRYEERCQDMEIILDSILDSTVNLVIADRNIDVEDESLQYPVKYRKNLIPSLEHELLQKMHKLFRFNLNFNSIKYSPTMCAMRVYELQAQATNLVSNYSKSLLNKFPNIRIMPVKENFNFDIANNSLFEYEVKIDSLREVLDTKTSYEINSKLANTIGLFHSLDKPKIVIFYKNFQSITASIQKQTYSHTLLFDFIELSNKTWEEIVKKEKIKYFTYFNEENDYEENYINDMVSTFKYTDVNYVTKNSYFYKNEYHQALEHEYTDYISGLDKAMFRADKHSPFDFIDYRWDEKIENVYNGYAIDPFELNYTKYLKSLNNTSSDIKLSVVVPVYNNGKYLKYKCLNSLMKNRYWLNFEIILIDDGSTDMETINICKKLKQQFNNIKIYLFGDGGSGSASRPRNKGIELANAELITFLDPDNEICPGGYDNLIDLYNENKDVDFISGYNVKVEKDVKYIAKHTSNKISIIENFKEKYFEKGKFPTIATQAAVISTRFLKEKRNLRFIEKAAGQDTLFGWELLLESNKGAFTANAFIIYYADRIDSVTNTVDLKYFAKKLILEKAQVEVFKRYGLLEIYKNSHFGNFMNNWYIPKLKKIDFREHDSAVDIIKQICKLYGLDEKINFEF